MPGKDGWACLDELREINKEVPIILCSGFDPDGSQFPKREDPALFSLRKPFRFEDLERILAQTR